MPTQQISPRHSNSFPEAERRWELTARADTAYRRAAIEVIGAWLPYQALTGTSMIRSWFSPTGPIRSSPSEAAQVCERLRSGRLLGWRIEDIAAPDLAAGTSATFESFLADGRQDGEYRSSLATAGRSRCATRRGRTTRSPAFTPPGSGRSDPQLRLLGVRTPALTSDRLSAVGRTMSPAASCRFIRNRHRPMAVGC